MVVVLAYIQLSIFSFHPHLFDQSDNLGGDILLLLSSLITTMDNLLLFVFVVTVDNFSKVVRLRRSEGGLVEEKRWKPC